MKYLIKICITIILTLTILILIKANSNFKTNFYKYVYDTNFSFDKFNKLYSKYVGDFSSFEKLDTKKVFNETLTYKSKDKYKDGVKLIVDKNYLVPINESGMVVFIGEKDNYGKCVIIQRIDGIDELYGNIDSVNVKLYDYVKKGDLLGSVDEFFYLVYKRDGKIMNYEEVLK